MGSDKLFQKRKALSKSQLKRRPASKNPERRILIVCEGEKTEVIYFKYMAKKFGLQATDSYYVKITGDCGSSPTSVVKYAEELAKEEYDLGNNGYDKVFCVFDKDSHTDYHSAISLGQTLNKGRILKGKIETIKSVPCFEYWFIMHFKYTRAVYNASRGKSIGDMVLRDLKRISDFSKYNKIISEDQLNILFNNHEKAIENAEYGMEEYKKVGGDNPTTEVFKIINYFKETDELKNVVITKK